MSEIVRLENVSKLYAQGDNLVRALDGVSLSIREGDFIAITGPSGSGKSTLLNVIGLTARATGGEIYIGGKPVSRLKEKEEEQLRRSVGKVFQQFFLLGDFSALENVALALAVFDYDKKKRNSIAQRCLEQLGLGDRLHHKPAALSGGEQQRVAIARAISIEPLIIVADEPTGNLDTKNGEEVLDIFFETNKGGQTILFVTHNEKIASMIPKRVEMQDGRVIKHNLE